MSNKPSIRPVDLALLFLVASALLFPALGGTPFRRAEIYFADSSRAMVERGDWLVPYFRGEPFFDKPALTYWLIATSFKVFGFSVSSARLVPAVAALLVIGATVWLGWLLWKDRASALAGGWVLVATVSFMAFGRTAMSDMLLTLWTILAMGLAVACYRTAKPPAILVAALGGVLGLGFLTKGPVALLIPGLGLLCLLWIRRERRPVLSVSVLMLSLTVFALCAAGWFVAVYLRMGWPPLEHFFLRENLQRFSGATYNAGRPVWFYLVAYLGEGAPWSFFLVPAVYRLGFQERDQSVRFLLLWMLLVTVLLTASRGKVDYYLLPLYPVAALCVGRYFCRAHWLRWERIAAATILIVMALLVLALPLALTRLPLQWRPQGLSLAGVFVVFGIVGLVGVISVFRLRPATALGTLVFISVATYGILNVFVLPRFYSAQPNDALVEDVSRERLARPDAAMASHGDPIFVHRDLLFRNRLTVEDSNELKTLAESSKAYLLLSEPAEADSLKALPGVREVRTYEYVSSRVFTLRGVLAPSPPERIVLLANFGR